MTFVEKVLAGDEFADRIDDYVAKWHESPRQQPLAAFLGLSRDEYGMWVEQPDSLHSILFARRNGVPVDQPDWDVAHLLAARPARLAEEKRASDGAPNSIEQNERRSRISPNSHNAADVHPLRHERG